MPRGLMLTALCVLAVVLLLAANTARNYAGWQPLITTPEGREVLLSPAWRVLRPPGRGPHPGAILVSGCDGNHDNMDYWAGQLTAQGRAVLILDSHRPRHLDRIQAWRAVCAGQILPGPERAADIAVALHAMRLMAGIDASDIVVMGASHGGWSVMELMRLLDAGTPPPGLSRWPASHASLVRQISGVVLLYPYCGFVSAAGTATWPEHLRGLLVLAQHDHIVSSGDCRVMANGLINRGADLRIVTMPNVDHGFDQQERSIISPLIFDEQARDGAADELRDFLRGFAPRPGGL